MRRNMELTGYTMAFYDAREVAMTRLQDEARGLAAAGVVGVTTAERSHVWGSRVIEFFAIGTAVASVGGESALDPPLLALSLNDAIPTTDPASIVEERATNPPNASSPPADGARSGVQA
jgi:hypothetical protein